MIEDVAANLVNNAGGYIQNGKNVVVDGAANLAQLAAIDLLTNGTLEYQLIADSSENLYANSNGYLKLDKNILLSDNPSATQLAAINNATTGTSLLMIWLPP